MMLPSFIIRMMIKSCFYMFVPSIFDLLVDVWTLNIGNNIILMRFDFSEQIAVS